MRPPIRTRSAVTLLLSAMLAALVITPALAGSGSSALGGVSRNAAGRPAADYVVQRALAGTVVHQPDGRIRLGSGVFVGNNTYNTTGAYQTSSTLMLVPTTVAYRRFTFGISIQNDGTTVDRFTVKATGIAAAYYTVAYFRGTANITAAIVAGTYRTPSLALGAAYLITAVVTGSTNAVAGSGVARLVTIKSNADPTRKDAVKLVVKTLAM